MAHQLHILTSENGEPVGSLLADGVCERVVVVGIGVFFILYKQDLQEFDTNFLLELQPNHPHRRAHLPVFSGDVVVYLKSEK